MRDGRPILRGEPFTYTPADVQVIEIQRGPSHRFLGLLWRTWAVIGWAAAAYLFAKVMIGQ